MVFYSESVIDRNEVTRFTKEVKKLVKRKDEIGSSFIQNKKTFQIRIKAPSKNFFDFDFLIISYLGLLKEEFPNIQIQIHFPQSISELKALGDKTDNFVQKLVQHRSHINISTGKEVFTIFYKGKEYSNKSVFQSKSYIPPIFINEKTLKSIFNVKKEPTLNETLTAFFKFTTSDIEKEIAQDGKNSKSINGKDFFLITQRVYKRVKRDDYSKWNLDELMLLYLLKALSELRILKYVYESVLEKDKRSSYRVGRILINTSTEKIANAYKEGVLNSLKESGFFEYNTLEIFLFSLLVNDENTVLFKLPTNIQQLKNTIEPYFSEKVKHLINIDIHAKKKYIELYLKNLKRTLVYVKDLCYGIEELCKNIVEHSQEGGVGFGFISARIYSSEIIEQIAKPAKGWFNSFEKSHVGQMRFLDINVIDTGRAGIKQGYLKTIKKEKSILQLSSLIEEYQSDIEQINSFGVASFFDFSSITLMHQISRVKAKLGLLIFSDTIINIKRGYVRISSNSIDNDKEIKYHELYKTSNREAINSIEVLNNVQELGTSYNFILPISEEFKIVELNKQVEKINSGLSSSVYLELFKYGFETPKYFDHLSPEQKEQFVKLNKYIPTGQYKDADKYFKLEKLQEEILSKVKFDEILILDFKDLNPYLLNSSDWIRFLANLQFTLKSYPDIIVYGFDSDLLTQIIEISKIFDVRGEENVNFWIKQRQVLFYFKDESLRKEGITEDIWFNCLFGESTYLSFLKRNYELSHYHFNIFDLLKEDEQNRLDMSVKCSDNLDKSKFFVQGTNKLLAFDLLIQNESQNLFVKTTKSLLSQEIKDSITDD